MLIQGKMDHEVAAAVHVARETISRWRKNPFFQAHLNAERQALWTTAHERLRSLVHRSIDIVEAALRESDLKAAVELLKIVNVYGQVPAPSGPTDPEEIVFREVQTWHATAPQRTGPTVDPLQALINDNADQDAAHIRERLQAVRQAWGMDAGADR
jgi:hypothetical protein